MELFYVELEIVEGMRHLVCLHLFAITFEMVVTGQCYAVEFTFKNYPSKCFVSSFSAVTYRAKVEQTHLVTASLVA